MADSSFQGRRSSIIRPPLLSSTVFNVSQARSEERPSLLLNRTEIGHNVSSLMDLTGARDNDDVDHGRHLPDVLFGKFLELLQAQSNVMDIFDVVQEFIHSCGAIVEQLQLDLDRGVGGELGGKKRESSIAWLKQEIFTWRLLHVLYQDRILLHPGIAGDDDMDDGPTLGGSEVEVVGKLFSMNSTLREYQLVVDWLEVCYDQKENLNALHCHDRMTAWENTLFQLNNMQGVAFGRKHEIVRQVDPDAPVRDKLPLHALDEEDNARLSRAIFAAIRNGRSGDALNLCKHYGQIWRAAILEGWRLYEDPNVDLHTETQKLPVEGNPRRDIWKRCAWLMADSNKYDEYTRATAGVYCGHLGSLKTVLMSSWHDLLWGYLKVQIDIRVESELRGCCLKSYHSMPDEYWNGKMTLEQIFDELTVAKDVAVRDFAKSRLGVIQQHLILDSSGELLQHMCRWLDEAKQPLPIHQLRFMAHIVIFLWQINRIGGQQQHSHRIIGAYVDALIRRRDPILVAFYVAKLPNPLQIQLYAKYLEQLEEQPQRDAAFEAGLKMGLNLREITKFTVENIRLSCVEQIEEKTMRVGEISPTDLRKTRALEWLTYLPEQLDELMWQTNAMQRTFLCLSKTECARRAFAVVPSDVVTQLIGEYGSVDNLPAREQCSLREYLCYKVYLAGIDSYNEWLRLQQSRPKAPNAATGASIDNFSERMASEHKEQTYLSDLTRWEYKIKEQSTDTVKALYNVLLFPEGWLIDPFIANLPENAATLNWESRLVQMENLRSICLPEVALLLFDVMYKSGDFAGCVLLGDEIACEHRQLYKVYTKHKMAELLAKIADASLQLLNGKLDPWGYKMTA